MSMKGKKKFRSWGYQNHLISSVDKMLYCNLNESEKIILSNENMITGQELDERDVLKNWQEFVVTRQEHLENKLESGALSSEQLHIWKKLDELLKEQPGEISDTITRLVLSSTYMHYNKGFFDGMKLATIMGNL